MAEALTPDLCVIGGGPGGIAAARAAVSAGVEVVLVERKAMGGANIACGAIPLAALMSAASLYDALRRGPSLGVTAGQLQVNWPKVRDHVAGASAAAAAGVSAEHLAAEGIKVILARARFVDPRTIAAGEVTIRPRRTILAVGARAAPPALPGIENIEPLTAGDVFDFSRRMTHLIVVGASGDGLAFAQAHQRLGIDATVIDEGPLLPDEDPELAAVLAARLSRDGVRMRVGAKVARITRRRGGIRAVLQDGAEGEVAIDASHVLIAGGRRPAIEGLGLDAAGIVHDEHGIVVRNFRSTNRHVYAIGDAIAGEASVVRAEREAQAVVGALLYRRAPRINSAPLARATATDPQLAHIGLGEAAARGSHRDIRVWRYPFAENDRSAADQRGDGLLKVVATGRGRILGATALGVDAAEHIALWSLALDARLPLASLAALTAAYPSRASVARALALAAAPPGLTAGWRRRIIRVLGRLG